MTFHFCPMTTAIQTTIRLRKLSTQHLAFLFLSFLAFTGCDKPTEEEYEVLWSRTYGGSLHEQARSLVEKEGSYVFAGWTASKDGDVLGSHGGHDVWVGKVDGSGNLMWQRALGGTNGEQANSIKASSDGGYFVGGSTDGTNGDISAPANSSGAWLLKLNTTGQILWNQMPQSGWSKITAITTTSDNNLVATGWRVGTMGLNASWQYKASMQGDSLWFEHAGRSCESAAIIQAIDGGYLVAGRTNTKWSSSGALVEHNGYIYKTDAKGSVQWTKVLGGTQHDQFDGVYTNADGSIILAGHSGSNDGDVSGNKGAADGWLVKLNAQGDLLWQKTIGGSGTDAFTSIFRTKDGQFLLSGFTDSNDGDAGNNAGGKDAWIVVVDDNGNLVKKLTLGGSGDDGANGVREDADGAYLLWGYSSSSDMDVPKHQGNGDVWLMRFRTK